ncbi:MAG: isoprenyl transferase [Dysgonamonadaceae bacterium]|jgi:undecaprenyl diphosphate synthase|nr:isoprenyl transferase [Dysgonamonadaceae bacterium]MDD3727345.1 isoprenyl transferase [Dysgonamonadaceae bacterium]MDD4245919.1 isoprenyl transferase [Dysgonamonadaceae bacterium]MDD4605413.1 isoprenyl transferase [Dysgonamonadaceae bacterium]HUI32312.1 isoprenyl transferase [Dysgonamonadaceae bacterium]
MSLLDKIDTKNIPSHIAIIMDGNGRWAKERGLDRTDGHQEGVVAVRRIVEAASRAGINFLTVYAFSTENWNRPNKEVEALMELMVYAIVKETPDLIKQGVRLLVIGDSNRLPTKTRAALDNCINETANGTTITLILALSYSSKWEITEALRNMLNDIQSKRLRVDDLNEKTLSNYLTTKGIPDPDLLIRTGGEKRISNFLLWQLAYAELYFTNVFWPDFDAEHLYQAILDFQCRERRFGKTSEQIEKEQKE